MNHASVSAAIARASDSEAMRQFEAAHKEMMQPIRAGYMEDARECVLSFLRIILALPSRDRDIVMRRATGETWQQIGAAMGGKSRQAAEQIHGDIMARHPDVAEFFKATNNQGA